MNLCMGSYRIFSVFSFLSFSLFLLVNPLTLIPMVYYSPTSSTFSSCPSFILLIPHLTFSPTPAFMSCHLAFILWFSNCNLSFITSVFYNVSPTLFLSISLLTFFSPPLQTVHSLSGSFSWRVERLLDWYVEGSSQQQDLALQLHGALENSTVRHRQPAGRGKSSRGSWQIHILRPWTCAAAWSTARRTG